MSSTPESKRPPSTTATTSPAGRAGLDYDSGFGVDYVCTVIGYQARIKQAQVTMTFSQLGASPLMAGAILAVAGCEASAIAPCTRFVDGEAVACRCAS